MIKFIDKEDTDRFEKACKDWLEEHCKTKESAIKKLIEMGFLDFDGNLHDNYK